MSRILERSSPLNLENIVAVVTGCSTGLGVSICRSLLNCNAFVLGVDINDAHETTNGRPGKGTHFQHLRIDITDPTAGEKIIARSAEEYGAHLGIGLLLNVAGIYDDSKGAHNFDDETFARVMKVNLEAPVRLMRTVVSSMLEKEKAGVIINIGGKHVAEGGTGITFAASKEALVRIGATKRTAETYRSQGIRCYIVVPGGLSENHPSDRVKSPTRDIANTVLFLASAMGKGIASGEVVHVGAM
ncbi:Hypothetical protein R9X50_00358800 [Acrodontium crateriforme]|uniref:NAD(P)-binding protein n=1 Tax=Acrodontium crateriforme TaxID=150365 RepID=A0AAQ3M606_9PEZI|nr:Hypothetical protein R9X50_00358800 [Acrodontium crateriforme]